MEIPYAVKPRPDTGVYNAKLGMWLFLASEVMLFGGLFSAYILLRVGAPDGTWTHGLLSVTLGTINTCILALSAVTTLLAWAACKVGQFSKFKFYHACTILLAVTFLGIKSYEYSDKFHHYQILKADGKYVDGHFHSATYVDAAKQERIEPGYRGRSFMAGTNELTLASVTLNGFEAETLKDINEPEPGHHHEHTEISVPAAEIKKIGNYGPAHNTFTAIYFTLTGLHALHILGGIIVIAYLWGPGSKMWKTEPERFTNRVEVSGLFWHFVDLVWIFLFPVLYLT
ncbi:MAG TPA: cytochrome c oxidase subunit 3 [Candidatus Paceibacterota bacterium]|nr:cytochrome c oxidase subunit 3 [Candidatus Paceibacterota bacterium]